MWITSFKLFNKHVLKYNVCVCTRCPNMCVNDDKMNTSQGTLGTSQSLTLAPDLLSEVFPDS